MSYNKVTPEIVAALKKIVGEKGVSVDPDKLETYSHDEESEARYHHMPEVVVWAETTEQVAEVVKLANKELIPIVPRAAGTGLSCGAVPIFGGIVLSIEKMNKILKVDAENMYMVTQPGVRTTDVQDEAKKHGLLYAGDPCSGDSCFIGGNVATNAGGNRAVKYGTTRNQVYCFTGVTPTGEITTFGARLNKCSTGYALEQIVMGSEGTLAIITEITLKLVPLPTHVMDILAVFADLDTAVSMVMAVLKAGLKPACMELMDTPVIQANEKFIDVKLPHDEDGNYLLIQMEAASDDEMDIIAEKITEIAEGLNAMDVLVPDSDIIWKARKCTTEAVRAETLIASNEDMVVPVDKTPEAIRSMNGVCEKYGAASRMVAHAGDGNIHLVVMQGNVKEEDWPEVLEKIHHEVFDVLYKMGGRISGEHGIGYKKKALMQEYTDPVQLNLMRALKKAWDPNLILNPGKIFDC